MFRSYFYYLSRVLLRRDSCPLKLNCNFNKYNILNLIMDQICPQSRQIGSLLRTSILFLEICNNEHIFITLFDYIGFQAFISLSTSNSKVYQTVNTQEGVQVRLLRRRINKLKQKQLQRNFTNLQWVDFNFFNPYTLPPYQRDLVEAESIDHQDELTRENALATQKLYNNELALKRVWGKWRAEKKAQAISGSKLSGKNKNQLKQSKLLLKGDNIQSQKLNSVKKAEQILNLHMEIRRKVLEEFPKTKNQLEDIRNRHFAEKILGQKLPSDQKQTKYSNLKELKTHDHVDAQKKIKNKPKSIRQQEVPWEFCVKEIVVSQIHKKKVRDELLWKPIEKTTQNVKKGLHTLLEAPISAAKMVKNNLKVFINPSKN